MIPGWMTMLAQSASDNNEGLYPKDKATMFDPNNFCRQQTQSNDKIDANGAQVKVRSSSSEGMFFTQEDCCQNLYCLEDTCDKFDKSDCSKQDYGCKINCGSSGPSPEPSHGKHHKNHHKPRDVDCSSGPKYICGQDCSSEKKCYVQEDCTELTTAGTQDKVYDADQFQCCVNYMELNGERRQKPAFDEDTTADDTLVRCQDVVKNRKTDYPQQEPAGKGGYKDCGENGELCPSISPTMAPSPVTASPTTSPAPTISPAPTTSHHHHHPPSMAPAATSPSASNSSPAVSYSSPAGARPAPLGLRPTSPTSSRTAPRLLEPPQAPKLSPRSQDPFGAHRRITTGLRGSSPMRPAVGTRGPRR